MSGSYLYKTQEEKNQYIKDIFNTLIVRDIKQKYKIRNTDIIQNLTDYLMDNVSNLTSANNITKILNSNNVSITDKTINNYIDYLCHAFAFYKVKRFDIRGKKYLSTQNKYYLAAQSFRYAMLGTNNMDYDFVAKKQGEQIYIQVSDNISEEKTFNREIAPLLSIKNAYPKIIIARTKHEEYSYEGVKIIDIAMWLNN